MVRVLIALEISTRPNKLYSCSGCHIPDMNFTFNGNFLDDGRIPVNNTISFECSDNRTLQSKCVIEDNSDADNGFWEPDPTVCPNITGI